MRSETTYEQADDIRDIAERLIARYGLHLGHVDLDLITFQRKWGHRAKKSQVGEIAGIKGYAKKRLEELGEIFEYEFSVWADAWDQVHQSVQRVLIFHALYSIPPEGGGKLEQPDVQEFGPICDYFGPYWRREKVVEDLLDDDPLVIPLPPEIESADDGATTEYEN